MSEKRQFKVYSSKHIIEGESKNRLLFDLMDKLEAFDEAVLKDQLKTANKQTTYLKADLHFLYQNILKSLLLFHAGKSAQIILNESHTKIEILYYRGQFAAALKELHKVFKLATECELFPDLIKLLYSERQLMAHLPGQQRSATLINKETQAIIHRQQILDTYQELYDAAHRIRLKVSKTRSEQQLKEFDQLMRHPLLVSSSAANSLSARIKYHQIHAMWNFIHGKKKEELRTNKKIISLFDLHPLYKEEHLLEYVNTHSRIISISKDLPPLQFQQALEDMRSIPVPSDKLYHARIAAQVFNFSYMIELSAYLQKKQFHKAGGIIGDIESGLKKYQKILTPSHHITFLYMLAYYFFAIGDYDTARKRINTLLNEYTDKQRPDLYHFARLLNLLIHFELKNYTYIKYKCANVHYYFKKQSAQFETENIVLRFFLRERNYTKDIEKNLLALKNELEDTKSHALEKYAFNYIDFTDWVNSKLEQKRSIAQLYEK